VNQFWDMKLKHGLPVDAILVAKMLTVLTNILKLTTGSNLRKKEV
jgi:hypothetical protein